MVSVNTTEVRRLADQLERSFHGGAWHGPATREVLSGIAATAANRRSDGAPHTIAELVRHITFWLNAAHLRMMGDRGVDPRADWPKVKTLTDEEWTRAVADLEQAHAKLHTVLLEFADDRLDDAVPGADSTVGGLLLGILQHNAYHTGQIVQIAQEVNI